ncbi:HAMP domain-containing sensor histidine kinase [Marinobacter sp.]|uniref:sensor histidine kinase n=1 Tax=Marinobacter sp. TaxID=50741 RepID=UPI00235718D4|nr:HAMP domain-containing sensor histidine kinase [Marinobacter sp.]
MALQRGIGELDHLHHPKKTDTRGVATAYFDAQRRFLDLFLRRHLSRLSQQDLRRSRVMVALLIFGILAMFAMAVVRLTTEGIGPVSVVVCVGVLAIIASLVFFVRTGKSGAAGDLLILSGVAVIFMTAINDNGLHSRVLTWLPSLPLIANFTSARLTAMRTTLLALFGLLMLLAAHEMQWIASSYPDESLVGRLAAGFGSMLFVSAIAYAYEDSRRQADKERDALSRTRSDWVSMVSHELRTPLTSLYGGLKLLANGKLDEQPETQQTLLTMSTRNTERLIGLVNDVLDVERLSESRFELNLKMIDLADVVDEAVKIQQYLADERGIALRTRLEPGSSVMADPDRLLQVVQNLLSNAIKFSHAGGEVVVHLAPSEAGIMCNVQDEGEGVSEAFSNHLFERFAQQTSDTRRRSGGSGLGLYISKGIIELHGGQIGYRPRDTGGSEFFFTLPER